MRKISKRNKAKISRSFKSIRRFIPKAAKLTYCFSRETTWEDGKVLYSPMRYFRVAA